MSELIKRTISSLILLIILIFSLKSLIFLFVVLLLISFFSIYEFNYIFYKIFKKKNFYYFLFVMISLIYIAYFTSAIWIYLIPQNDDRIISVLLVIMVSSLSDIGGYSFGKIIGGKKLTRISPKKTYSGLIGSFILPLISGYIYYKYFKEFLFFEINILILILLLSFISQVGDLIISFLKRKAKIKNTGSILPGHGGILDRIDSALLTLPLGIILISI